MNLNPYSTPYTKIKVEHTPKCKSNNYEISRTRENLSNPELNRTHRLGKKSK